MRTIFVKSAEYDMIEDYINACLIESHLSFRDIYICSDSKLVGQYVDIRKASISMCTGLNAMLANTLSEEQYSTFKEAEREAEENEAITLIDMPTLSKYIDIRIR